MDNERSADTDHGPTEESSYPNPVCEQLSAHAVRFEQTPPDQTAFEPLRPRFAAAAVIGLGEMTHGTRECFQCKHRLLRYLVTELGVRTLALEANLPETRRLNDYVVHGENDPVESLERLYFWIYPTDSVLRMVEWLRKFNADRPLEDRVQVAGFDMQYTQGAVESLHTLFEHVEPSVCDRHDDAFQTANDNGVPPGNDDHRPTRVQAIERLVPALRDRLDASADDYRVQTSQRRVERARRDLHVLEQAAAYRRVYETTTGDELDAETLEQLRAVRDTAMADNATWIRRRADAPIVCWGHDAHLNRIANRSRQTTAAAPSMGARLADRYNDRYLAVGFAAGQLGFRAFGPSEDGFELQRWEIDGPLAGTTEAAVAEATDDEPALVDLRAASGNDQPADWLARRRPHCSVGATYEPGELSDYCTAYACGEAFDLLWYLPETTPTRPVTE